jgi:esterase/lipase
VECFAIMQQPPVAFNSGALHTRHGTSSFCIRQNLCNLPHNHSFAETGAVQADRLQPSGLNSHFAFEGDSFAEYIEATRAMLAQVHRGADAAARIDGNAPFELLPQSNGKRRGILLSHGLLDSPYHMRHLATFFQGQGFHVMAPLLPGHGTVPGDQLDMQWQEWARAVAFGANCLAKEVDELYLGGFSAGGTLSLRHSLLDGRVRGLFLFVPALRISPVARLASLHKLYSWLLPSAKWVEVLPDRDLYKYESFAKNSAAQTWKLIADLQQGLRQQMPAAPVFAAASMDDTTVDTHATLEFLATAPHPANQLVLYTTNPEEFSGLPSVEAVNSTLPEQRILSSAHTAIVIAPEDAHYGIGGDYANCLHYYRSAPEKYKSCWAEPEVAWQGELTRRNLNAGILRRLMYNPHFAALETSMRHFIANLPGSGT